MANAKLAYQHYQQATFNGPRWEFLAGKWRNLRPSACCGPRPRPRIRPTCDTLYVEDLIVPDTVNTMPEETVRAFLVITAHPQVDA